MSLPLIFAPMAIASRRPPADRDVGVFRFYLGVRHADQVDEDGHAPAVERYGILHVAFADHIVRGHAGHRFHGPVPRDDFSGIVYNQRRVGIELDDVGKLSIGLFQPVVQRIFLLGYP